MITYQFLITQCLIWLCSFSSNFIIRRPSKGNLTQYLDNPVANPRKILHFAMHALPSSINVTSYIYIQCIKNKAIISSENNITFSAMVSSLTSRWTPWTLCCVCEIKVFIYSYFKSQSPEPIRNQYKPQIIKYFSSYDYNCEASEHWARKMQAFFELGLQLRNA